MMAGNPIPESFASSDSSNNSSDAAAAAAGESGLTGATFNASKARMLKKEVDIKSTRQTMPAETKTEDRKRATCWWLRVQNRSLGWSLVWVWLELVRAFQVFSRRVV